MEQVFDPNRRTTLTAGTFEQMSADERAERSAELVCPGCGAQAFFRRRSRDGRAPCFYSLAHEPDCPVATPDISRSRAGSQRVQRALEEGGRLRLRFGRSQAAETDAAPEAEGRGDTQRTARPPRDRSENRAGTRATPIAGLGGLLDHLIAHPEFADSQTFIETEDGYTWRARNLLRRFADADPDEDPLRPHLFFGPLTGASWDLNWLHTGRGRAVRIRVRPLRRAVLEAQGYTHPAEFAGAWVIVFGRCYRPENGAPPYIEIHRQAGERRADPAHLYLQVE